MAERVLMKGNEALAEAVIQAGCRHFFGYPITPQNEVCAYFSKRMPQVNGTYLQAESEIAAINMVLGAASAGVRAITSSSSPGISLKTEGLSYLAGSDLPCLVVNVQRGGPGLGGIQPSQADYYQATKAPGHGDTHILVLAPASVQEMVDLPYKAYELAEHYRMPAMILADGLLGQMMEPVVFSEVEVKQTEKPWATTGHENKRKTNIVNSLYLDPAVLEEKVLERFKRYAHIEENEVICEEYLLDDAQLVLVAYGATSRICKSAIDEARAQGLSVGLLRPITLWPFPVKELSRLAEAGKQFLTVEMNMGQMVNDVRLAVEGKSAVSFYGRTGGIVPTPQEVLRKIQELLGGGQA
ncbi:MAG: 3-methyl-2-oxobutanoate dehydrogenase subunit VorB [Clostridiales bacterium]|nr:3-methyl-2-oxobutanoate dehydrogenase subunit VorB [Clostridiales bacterium]